MELTQENSKVKTEEFKEKNIEFVKKTLVEYSGLAPVMSILIYDLVKNSYETVVVNVPDEVLNSSASKDIFGMMGPLIMQKLFEDKKKTICISWSTEAWIRTTDDKKNLDNWKDLPKSEALVTYYETEEGSSIICHTMTRDGMRVNMDGDMVDDIKLEYDEKSSSKDKNMTIEGRFTNAFRKFNQLLENEK